MSKLANLNIYRYIIQNFNFKKLLLKQTENNELKKTILLEFWKEIEFNTIKNLKNCENRIRKEQF